MRAVQGRVPCSEALTCVGVLAEALHDSWKPHAAGLLEGMVLSGLSQGLVDALTKVELDGDGGWYMVIRPQ